MRENCSFHLSNKNMFGIFFPLTDSQIPQTRILLQGDVLPCKFSRRYMSFRYSFCGLILWVNFKEIITFETSNTSFKLSFFFLNEMDPKRFIFRFGLQHPGIFLKHNP